MSCLSEVSVNLDIDCNNKPVGGLIDKLVLINYNDWSNGAKQADKDLTNPNELFKSITLNAGKKGFFVEFVKATASYTATPVIAEDNLTGVTHSITIPRFNPSVEAQEVFNQLLNGRVIAVVERAWHGVDAQNAFLVIGQGIGLTVSEGGEGSTENITPVLTLSTDDGRTENSYPHQLLDTDYDTTKALFDGLFEAPVAP
jgi:hypothetical protein